MEAILEVSKEVKMVLVFFNVMSHQDEGDYNFPDSISLFVHCHDFLGISYCLLYGLAFRVFLLLD